MPAESRPRTVVTRVVTAAGQAPAWARLSSLALSVAGLAVAGYLTVEHFTQNATLACLDRAGVSCLQVTTSEQSAVLGMPWALLGLLYFVAMVALTTPVAWRYPRLDRPRLAAAIVGVASVIYLIYAELFKVDAICLWCTAVHVITVALFAVLTLSAATAPR